MKRNKWIVYVLGGILIFMMISLYKQMHDNRQIIDAFQRGDTTTARKLLNKD